MSEHVAKPFTVLFQVHIESTALVEKLVWKDHDKTETFCWVLQKFGVDKFLTFFLIFLFTSNLWKSIVEKYNTILFSKKYKRN